ncbi:hypothetical protein M231_04467 [Tremella mesenterica]|uniref:Uncharacterized protein n=1 Tax=Tremella mesenterica TaxID=5217 RepID=A0A4Q1BKL7_TREME|nr:hypothetical protein M231_04467 [Tremella mesenterica]
MNTVKSVIYGWGVLIVAGAGAYYYAKKDIDARRQDQKYRGARPMDKLSWQERIEQSPSEPILSRAGTSTAPGETSVEVKSTPSGLGSPTRPPEVR